MLTKRAPELLKPKILVGLIILISACLFVVSCAASGTAVRELPRSRSLATSITVEVRQTDDQGRSLPFKTVFPNRWSFRNNGTSYEPCTAVSSKALRVLGADAASVRDSASADSQTARGCSWTISAGDVKFASVSQVVGNSPPLSEYKQARAGTVQWMPDISFAGRPALVGTSLIGECEIHVRSGSAGVGTIVTFLVDPPPTSEICAKAIAFTRATIDQMPP